MITGPDLHAEHVLADGTHVIIRHIRPDDAEMLRDGFRHLSAESRYRRFFGGVSELSDEMLRYLTDVDGVDHVALVAGQESPDLKTERGLGVARFIRSTEDPEVAEAAVTVVDDAQRKGLGRILLLLLAQAARDRGIKRFRAEVLARNEPVRHILQEVGANMHREDGEAISFDVDLGPSDVSDASDPSLPLLSLRPSALSRLLREAATSMAILIRNFRLTSGAPSEPPAPH